MKMRLFSKKTPGLNGPQIFNNSVDRKATAAPGKTRTSGTLKSFTLYYRLVDKLIDLRTPDAIQISTALKAGATLFFTNDIRLPEIPYIQILLLDSLS